MAEQKRTGISLTAAQRRTRMAFYRWLKKDKPEQSVEGIRHIHARAYVVGHAAPGCLVVATPWVDSEPQCRDFDKGNPLGIIRRFDQSLKAGDWCATAYVSAPGIGERVAIPVVL